MKKTVLIAFFDWNKKIIIWNSRYILVHDNIFRRAGCSKPSRCVASCENSLVLLHHHCHPHPSAESFSESDPSRFTHLPVLSFWPQLYPVYPCVQTVVMSVFSFLSFSNACSCGSLMSLWCVIPYQPPSGYLDMPTCLDNLSGHSPDLLPPPSCSACLCVYHADRRWHHYCPSGQCSHQGLHSYCAVIYKCNPPSLSLIIVIQVLQN